MYTLFQKTQTMHAFNDITIVINGAWESRSSRGSIYYLDE